MEFIKKHWKIGLVLIFALLFLSTCVNNCSNKNKIRTMEQYYSSMDSIVADMRDSITLYKGTIKDLKRDIEELKRDNFNIKQHNADLNKALKRNVVVNITSDKDEEK